MACPYLAYSRIALQLIAISKLSFASKVAQIAYFEIALR